jgi:single-stranded-DNA-specific exonuclease
MTQLKTRSYSFKDSELLRQQGIHPVLARIYAARGLSHINELSTALPSLLSPSQLLHIDTAASFLADAILANKKMTIVADYDCDGATACAVGVRGLKSLGAHIKYIVPNRFEYGYGLTPEIVNLTAKETEPNIIITVDNGIASIEGVKRAKELGIDVVITDHHLPGDKLPDAKVIVNPNQPKCSFPSKNLAGVGVMFYVLLALRKELRERGIFNENTQPKLDNLLDLVALGTVADVVKLDSNNRILVAQGLKRIRKGAMHAGISALFHVAGRQARNATPFDLGFAIGPRLNAAGRLQDMSLGIECLITDDANRAWKIAQELNSINIERRQIEAQMQDEALVHLDSFSPKYNCTITVFDTNWHQGVIGILASRLKDKFYRPTIAFAPADDGLLLKGSGRSISGFHLRDALDLLSKQHPTLIEKFGGHAMAAGLTIQAQNLSTFTNSFEKIAQSLLTKEQTEHTIETDGALEDAYFTTQFIALLNEQVWGQGFAPPIFCDTFRVLNQRILKEKHLKLQLEKNGQHYDAIWFGHANNLPEEATIAFRLDANEYNGQIRVQLMVEHAQTNLTSH